MERVLNLEGRTTPRPGDAAHATAFQAGVSSEERLFILEGPHIPADLGDPRMPRVSNPGFVLHLQPRRARAPRRLGR